VPLRDPTKSMPNRRPTGERPFLVEVVIWAGDVIRAFPGWVAYRFVAKTEALWHFRHAGECRECRANVTWRILGPRPGFCPECGCFDPCPEPPPSSGDAG
jgi:hypothetical protein